MRLHLFHAAKRAPRGEARLLRAHALATELVFEEQEMGVDLTREIGLGSAGAEKRREAKKKPPDGGNGVTIVTGHSSADNNHVLHLAVKWSRRERSRAPF